MTRPLSTTVFRALSWLFIAVLNAAALSLAGCSSADDAQGLEEAKPSRATVLVTISGLRFDRAISHSVFSDATAAYAPSSLDAQSLAALATGRLPSRAGALGLEEAQPPQEALTLASLLRRQGLSTAMVSQESWTSRPGFLRGFDWLETPPEAGWTDALVVERAIKVATNLSAADRPYFLAVHFSAPIELGPDDLDSSARSWLDPGRNLAARYDAAVREKLDQVASLVEQIDALGSGTKTQQPVLIVAATAGFELGEHGGHGNGWNVYEESIEVPLVVRLDRDQPPVLFEGPVSVVDLMPTILEISGYDDRALERAIGQSVDGFFDGTSLLEWGSEREGSVPSSVSLAQGRLQPVERRPEAVVISELVIRERAITRALLTHSGGAIFKYIHTTRTAPPEDRATVSRGYEELQAAMLSGAIPTPELFGPALVEEFFSISTDPRETHSLIAAGKVEDKAMSHALSRLRTELRAYSELCSRTAYQPMEITRRLEIDPNQIKALESLGYL